MTYHRNYTVDLSIPKNNADDLGKGKVLFEHNFLESGLFTDEKLIDLIENYPREHYMLTTMTAHGTKPEWFNGDFNGLSGKQILEAIFKGRFWLSLRRFDVNAPAYHDIAMQGFEKLDGLNPALNSTRHIHSLLISSPGARVLYHADVPMVTLWHIRGEKKFWLYDADNKEHLPDQVLEGIYLRETEEEIPYQEAWDKEADAIILKPGQGVTWQHNAPHRVDNLSGLNVSLTSEFYTPEATKRYGVIYANGIMRRKMGLHPKSIKSAGFGALSKCAMAVGMKKSKIFQAKERDMLLHFKLDPENIGQIIKVPKDQQKPIYQD